MLATPNANPHYSFSPLSFGPTITMTATLTELPRHCLSTQLTVASIQLGCSCSCSCSALAAFMTPSHPLACPSADEPLLCNYTCAVDAKVPVSCSSSTPTRWPAVFPFAQMHELVASGWHQKPMAPPYTPRVPFGHTHHPSLGHRDLLYMQHAAQGHEFYVELHPFPARYMLDAKMTALLEQLNIISGDALQASPGAGQTMEESHRHHLGHSRTSPNGLGTAHILGQLQPTLALVLIRDAVTHCARYYLRWDVYKGVIGAPVGFAVYGWQSEQKTYRCMSSWTRFMCRQQILRQRLQPAQQEQLRRVLVQVNRRYSTPVGSRARVNKLEMPSSAIMTSTSSFKSSASSSPLPMVPFVPENTLCMVLRTDNTRLLESRMKLSAAQFPDFTHVGSELPAIAAALLFWCQQHDRLELWQRSVEEGVVVKAERDSWVVDLPQLGCVVRSALSQQERTASEELTCADFRQWDGDSDQDEDVLDSSMLVRQLTELQSGNAQEIISWTNLIGQLHPYLRCLYRSTVPCQMAEMLDGVMRTSFEGVSSLSGADAYIWCVRNASPNVKQNINKKPATLPFVDDIYKLFARNTGDQGDSRNYLLNVLVMDIEDLADSRWEALD